MTTPVLRPRRRAPAPARPAPVRRVRVPLFLLLSLAAIGYATLTPSAHEGASGWDGCILCGDRGLADALLNVVLFGPLGMALARMRIRPLRAIAVGAVLSACIELAQLVIPGRDPTPPDLLFNTLGTALGYAVGTRMDVLLRPSDRAAGWMALAWSAAFAVVVGLTGWLTGPAPPPGPYVGQWTPEIGDYPLLPARVLEARIGGVPIPYGRLDGDAAVRDALARAAPIEIRWIVGWRIGEAAPLLRIVGRGGEEAVAVFIHGERAIVLHRTRAAALRLDRPSLAAPAVIRGIVPGDTVRMTVRMDGRRARFVTDAGHASADGLGPGRGWVLLLSRMETPAGTARALDAAWIALWMVPLGLWMRRRAIVIAGAALVVLPPLVSLALPGIAEMAGALLGLALGALLRKRL